MDISLSLVLGSGGKTEPLPPGLLFGRAGIILRGAGAPRVVRVLSGAAGIATGAAGDPLVQRELAGQAGITLGASGEPAASITFAAAFDNQTMTLDITNVALSGTTGPYEFYIATHADGTTLTAEEVIAATDPDIIEAFTFQDVDGEVTGQELTATQAVTDGRMSIVIRDVNDVTSDVAMLEGVTITIAPATWQAPTVDSIGDGSVTLSAGANTASSPSAPTIDAVGDGSVTLNAA